MKDACTIIVDVGTTTITGCLFSHGQSFRAATLNSQRMYGADVLNRVEAANDGEAKELRRLVCNDILSIIKALLTNSRVAPEAVQAVALAGNTTMLYLLYGIPCSILMRAPYKPLSKVPSCINFKSLFHSELLHCKVYAPPLVSAFFGADALAALHAAREQFAGNLLVLDFGTNCEMALSTPSAIYCASAPAGPAFEGGHITCGIGAVDGAIQKFTLENDGSASFACVGNAREPLGICGSGLIDITAELLRHKLLQVDGRFAQPYALDGYRLPIAAKRALTITPLDIREIQLAKAAVAAAIDMLLLHIDTPIDTVILCGQMGAALDVGNAVAVGLLPSWVKDCNVCRAADAVIDGVYTAMDKHSFDDLQQLKLQCRSLELEQDGGFEDIFVRHLSFPLK